MIYIIYIYISGTLNCDRNGMKNILIDMRGYHVDLSCRRFHHDMYWQFKLPGGGVGADEHC